jgi:hypothetical protein
MLAFSPKTGDGREPDRRGGTVGGIGRDECITRLGPRSVRPRVALERKSALLPAVSAAFRCRWVSPGGGRNPPPARARDRSQSEAGQRDENRRSEGAFPSQTPRNLVAVHLRHREARSRRRRLCRPGRRRDGLGWRRRNGSGCPLNSQDETRGRSQGRDRGRVGGRGRGLRDRTFRRVGGALPPGATEPQGAEGNHRQDPTGRFHRSPSAPTTFVSSSFESLTHFGAAVPAPRCKLLQCNEEDTPAPMVRRLILPSAKKSAGMGVPAWGGVEGLPPLFFGCSSSGRLNRLSGGGEAAPLCSRGTAKAIRGSSSPPRPRA